MDACFSSCKPRHASIYSDGFGKCMADQASKSCQRVSRAISGRQRWRWSPSSIVAREMYGDAMVVSLAARTEARGHVEDRPSPAAGAKF